jgi:hypothetical protein
MTGDTGSNITVTYAQPVVGLYTPTSSFERYHIAISSNVAGCPAAMEVLHNTVENTARIQYAPSRGVTHVLCLRKRAEVEYQPPDSVHLYMEVGFDAYDAFVSNNPPLNTAPLPPFVTTPEWASVLSQHTPPQPPHTL